MNRAIIQCFIATLLIITEAYADKPSLAVMDCYVGKGVKSIGAADLTDSIYAMIAMQDSFRLLPPPQSHALLTLERIGIHDSLCEYKDWDAVLALRIALKIGVRHIIAGSVLKNNDSAGLRLLKVDTIDRRTATEYYRTTDDSHAAIMQSVNDGVTVLSRSVIDTSLHSDIQKIPIVKTAPEISYKYIPEYSTPLSYSGAKGKVYIRVLIGTEGRVVTAEVAKSSGYEEIDLIALAAMQLWRFTPALDIDDKPISVWVMQAFRFVR